MHWPHFRSMQAFRNCPKAARITPMHFACCSSIVTNEHTSLQRAPSTLRVIKNQIYSKTSDLLIVLWPENWMKRIHDSYLHIGTAGSVFTFYVEDLNLILLKVQEAASQMKVKDLQISNTDAIFKMCTINEFKMVGNGALTKISIKPPKDILVESE